jgi:hypothetical protein
MTKTYTIHGLPDLPEGYGPELHHGRPPETHHLQIYCSTENCFNKIWKECEGYYGVPRIYALKIEKGED